MSKFETDYVCRQSSMILGECMRRRHEQSVHAYTIFALAYPPETGNGTRNVQTRLHSVTYILRTYYCIITWWIGLVENHHATNVYCTIQIYVLNVPGISYFSIYFIRRTQMPRQRHQHLLCSCCCFVGCLRSWYWHQSAAG